MSQQSEYQLNILDGDWASLRLGYDFQPAWTALQQAYASRIALVITEGDVETYAWSEQALTLTSQSTDAVIAKFARSDEQRKYPEAALDQRAFVVTLHGSPAYGGIFMHPMSSMGISFPVAYVATADDKVTLTLRPVHSILGDYTAYEPGWYGIKDQRIQDIFSKAGKLAP